MQKMSSDARESKKCAWLGIKRKPSALKTQTNIFDFVGKASKGKKSIGSRTKVLAKKSQTSQLEGSSFFSPDDSDASDDFQPCQRKLNSSFTSSKSPSHSESHSKFLAALDSPEKEDDQSRASVTVIEESQDDCSKENYDSICGLPAENFLLDSDSNLPDDDFPIRSAFASSWNNGTSSKTLATHDDSRIDGNGNGNGESKKKRLRVSRIISSDEDTDIVGENGKCSVAETQFFDDQDDLLNASLDSNRHNVGPSEISAELIIRNLKMDLDDDVFIHVIETNDALHFKSTPTTTIDKLKLVVNELYQLEFNTMEKICNRLQDCVTGSTLPKGVRELSNLRTLIHTKRLRFDEETRVRQSISASEIQEKKLIIKKPTLKMKNAGSKCTAKSLLNAQMQRTPEKVTKMCHDIEPARDVIETEPSHDRFTSPKNSSTPVLNKCNTLNPTLGNAELIPQNRPRLNNSGAITMHVADLLPKHSIEASPKDKFEDSPVSLQKKFTFKRLISAPALSNNTNVSSKNVQIQSSFASETINKRISDNACLSPLIHTKNKPSVELMETSEKRYQACVNISSEASTPSLRQDSWFDSPMAMAKVSAARPVCASGTVASTSGIRRLLGPNYPETRQEIHDSETDMFPDDDELYKCLSMEDIGEFEDEKPPSKEFLPPTSDKSKAEFFTSEGQFKGQFQNDGTDISLSRKDYPFSQPMLNLFRQVFGLKDFRTNQLQAINAALLGLDCFILMPTGGGKSLCYQLSAIVSGGVTVVISPLKSLIQDQVQKLCSLDVPAAHLSGNQTSAESDRIYNQLSLMQPSINLLYTTPEKISASGRLSSVFQNLYTRNLLSRFVIDEAHCVSQWGHDFRPDYKKLSCLRTNYPGVPIMALTATATPRVRVDIINQIKLEKPKCFVQSFNRPNLKYIVAPKKGKSTLNEMTELLQEKYSKLSGIIYCLSRNDCENTAKFLKGSGVSVAAYHAGLSDDMRKKVQDQWLNDKLKVICATIAFGMGIDKPNVRFVFHFNLPKSIEGYYQEAGRAGRDGRPATCILYYSYQDVIRHRRLIDTDESNHAAKATHHENLTRIVHFCESKTECRRLLQLDYFGEVFDSSLCSKNSQTCDNCLSKESYENIDATVRAVGIVKSLQILKDRRSSITLLQLLELFRGSTAKKVLDGGQNSLPLYGTGKDWSSADGERLMRKMVLNNILQEELVTKNDHAYAYIRLGENATKLLSGNSKFMFPMQIRTQGRGTTAMASGSTAQGGAVGQAQQDLQTQCYDELLAACKKFATEQSIYYTNVINLEALRIMSVDLPMTQDEMMKIPYVTKANYEKYCHELLKITQTYAFHKSELIQDDKDDFAMNLLPEPGSANDASSIYFSSPSKRGTKRKGGWSKRQYWKQKSKSTSSPKGSKTREKWISAKSASGSAKRPSLAQKQAAAKGATCVKAPGFLSIPKSKKFTI